MPSSFLESVALATGAVAAIALLSSCGAPTPTFHAQRTPESLSEWGMLVREDGALRPADGVLPFDLNTALFSDYAHKLRTVWMPEGTVAGYRPTDTFDFPVGTVITKTFFYPRGDGPEQVRRTLAAPEGTTSVELAGHRLVETRLLVHRDSGWVSLPYVWNEAQNEASLRVVGADLSLELVSAEGTTHPFTYSVPDANQCAGCHVTNQTTRAIQPIGPKARHLNRRLGYADGPADQLHRWRSEGILDRLPEDAPKAASWTGAATADELARSPERLDQVARAYLDVNCSHCHNPVGPADTSALYLDPDTPRGFQLGLCKPPVAAGRGTGERLYAIHPGRSDDSILTHRLASVEPAVAMPELGRGTVHEEGVALLEAWIDSLPGDC